MAKKKAAKKTTKKVATKKPATKRPAKKSSKTTKAATTGRGATRKKSSKRELINTGRDKRYVRRDEQGRFNESDDVGRSLSQDRQRKAKTTTKSGQGDRGDRRR